MNHPNELDQQLDNLRTLQQSYDQVAGAAEAYNTGKVQLAANITGKGVPASATETLPELAAKVEEIVQTQQVINGGEMYAKQLFGSLETPNYWNLYEVLANLLSDGRLVNYGGILLAEYYRGYDSLALAGAGAGGAYVVSDMENGQFKMYTEDTTHTWATEFDGKGNRWVAYCFADEYHDFQITNTNTSPRSIFIGRKVGSIISLVNGRSAKIVVPDGNELRNISGHYTQQWDKEVILKNIGSLSGSALWQPSSVESIYAQIKELNGGAIVDADENASAATNIKSVIFYIENAISGSLFGGGNSRPTFNQVAEIILKAEGCVYTTKNYNAAVTFNALKEFIIYAEGLLVISQTGDKFPSSGRMVLNYITNDKTKQVSLFTRHADTHNQWLNMTDCELKDGWCKPVNIALMKGLTEENMYAHILQRLKQDEPDCGDGVTITLGATNLTKLTSEESVQLLDDLTNVYGYTFA